MFTTTINALKIINLSFRKMLTDPLILVLGGMSIISISAFLTIFFVIEHVYLGFKIIDFSTLGDFLNSPLTTHFFHTLFCILGFIMVVFIFTVFSYIFTYIIKFNDLNRPLSPQELYNYLKEVWIKLLRDAAIMTFGYFKSFLNLFSISNKLDQLQEIVDKNVKTEEKDKYYNSRSLFIYPLLMEHSSLDLKEAREEVNNLIEKKFGKGAYPLYSFSLINYSIFACICLLKYILYIYNIMDLETAFLIALVLLIIYFTIMRIVFISFTVAVYHYVQNKPTHLYPIDFIAQSFISPSNEKSLSIKSQEYLQK